MTLQEDVALLRNYGGGQPTRSLRVASERVMGFLDSVLLTREILRNENPNELLSRGYYYDVGPEGIAILCMREFVGSEDEQVSIFARDVAGGFLNEFYESLTRVDKAEAEFVRAELGI